MVDKLALFEKLRATKYSIDHRDEKIWKHKIVNATHKLINILQEIDYDQVRSCRSCFYISNHPKLEEMRKLADICGSEDYITHAFRVNVRSEDGKIVVIHLWDPIR